MLVLSFNTPTNIANICVYTTGDDPDNCDSVNREWRKKKTVDAHIYVWNVDSAVVISQHPLLSSLIILSSCFRVLSMLLLIWIGVCHGVS